MVALCLGAAVAIAVILTDATGDLGPRLLGTTGFAALAALTGLCASLLLGRGRLVAVGVFGIVVSAGTFLVAMAYVWEVVVPATPKDIRPLGAGVAASIAAGWVSLVLLLTGRSLAVTTAALVTVASVATLAGLILAVILLEGEPGTALSRATAVAAVVAALGSFLTPLLERATRGPGAGDRTERSNDSIRSTWAG
jgi:hypothetical protein